MKSVLNPDDLDTRTAAQVERLGEIEEELAAWLPELPSLGRPHLEAALTSLRLAIANSRHPGLHSVSLDEAVEAGIPVVLGRQVNRRSF